MDQSHVIENPGPTSSAPPSTIPDQTLPTPPRTPSKQVESNDANTGQHLEMHKAHHRHTASNASEDTASSQRARKEYMDSLVPPSSEEMTRISQIQVQREQQEKRRSRQHEKEQRRSMEISRSSVDMQEKPTRSSIFSNHRQKKSDGARRSRQSSSITTSAIASATAAGEAPEDGESLRAHRAATLIQRTFRGYRTRREIKGLGLNADTRWTHAIREMKFREMTKPRGKDDIPMPVGTEASQKGLGAAGSEEAARRSSSARYKWKKIAVIAGRAAGDMDDDPTGSSDSDSDSDSKISTPEKRRKAHQKREEAKARRRKDAQMMGLPYFLEMVDQVGILFPSYEASPNIWHTGLYRSSSYIDQKHRYGSNLRTYHEEWKKADTQEPFFYWLDYGEGRNVEMAACPRERLDREQVRYLSREERQYYVVQVDSEGRLCWAKNGARIDTTEKWKDSIHGIVPADDPTPSFQPKSTNPNQPKLFPSDSSSSSSSSSAISHASESELEAARAAKYASPGFQDAKGVKKVTHLSASTIFNTLLRKSVRKNTWIFVADTSFRLYVGIKNSGAFQHSSFLQGSRISAAGLIKIKNGRLTSLSPLSGHYRPPASNFRAFVRSLKEEGVDMSRVSISKSYAVLVGLETYMKMRRKGKDLLKTAKHKKDKIVHPEVAHAREEDEKDKSQSAEKERQFLEKQAAEEENRREENKAAARVMQKLGISPAVPERQEDEGEVARAGEAQDTMMDEITEAKTEETAGAASGMPTGAVDENNSMTNGNAK